MLRFTDNIIAQMTRECNLHCPHCYEGHDPYWVGKKIDHEKFKQILDTYIYQRCILGQNPRALVKFHFHGGEVLLLDPEELKKDILYLEKRKKSFPGISFLIQSNGVNLTEDLAEFFVENNIRFGCSFDGYKSSRMSEDECHKLVDRLRYFHEKIGLRIGILGVLGSDNIKYWMKDARTLEDFSEGFGVNIMCSMDERDIPTQDELWDYWIEPTLQSWLTDKPFMERTIMGYIQRILDQIIFGYIPLGEKTGCFDRLCGFGSNMTSINPDLKLGTCDKYLSGAPFTKTKEIFTDLTQLDFLGAQQMNRLFQYYKGITEESNKKGCSFCPMKWICSGECQSYSLSKFGEIKLNDDLCKGYKRIYEFISKNWVELARKHPRELPGGEHDVTCYAREILEKNNMKLSCCDGKTYQVIEKEVL